ncbi:hypothetical protein D3C71_845880 [compost metagenome]
MAGIKHHIRARGQKQLQVIFGSGIDDDRHTLGMGDFDEFGKMQQAIVDDMVRNDINCRRRLFGDGVFHVETMGGCRLPDQHHLAATKPDGLIHRCAIAHHMAHLHQNLVLFRGHIGQLFDGQKIVAGDRTRHRKADAGGAGGRDETGLAARQPRNHRACLALQIVDLDKLRQDGRHGFNRFRNDDGSAERGHGARDVDDRAKADPASDILGHVFLLSLRCAWHRHICHNNVIASQNS